MNLQDSKFVLVAQLEDELPVLIYFKLGFGHEFAPLGLEQFELIRIYSWELREEVLPSDISEAELNFVLEVLIFVRKCLVYGELPA